MTAACAPAYCGGKEEERGLLMDQLSPLVFVASASCALGCTGSGPFLSAALNVNTSSRSGKSRSSRSCFSCRRFSLFSSSSSAKWAFRSSSSMVLAKIASFVSLTVVRSSSACQRTHAPSRSARPRHCVLSRHSAVACLSPHCCNSPDELDLSGVSIRLCSPL